MVGYSASDLDVESAVHHLNEDGYILVEGMLNRDEVEEIRGEADDLDLPPIFVPPAMLVQQGQGVEQQAAQSPGPAAYSPASCEA